MTDKKIPELIQLFTNLLWANSPNHWILKSAYFRETLFISILLKEDRRNPCKKIRRSFNINLIHSRVNDLWGLAVDCIDEMKTEEKK